MGFGYVTGYATREVPLTFFYSPLCTLELRSDRTRNDPPCYIMLVVLHSGTEIESRMDSVERDLGVIGAVKRVLQDLVGHLMETTGNSSTRSLSVVDLNEGGRRGVKCRLQEGQILVVVDVRVSP